MLIYTIFQRVRGWEVGIVVGTKSETTNDEGFFLDAQLSAAAPRYLILPAAEVMPLANTRVFGNLAISAIWVQHESKKLRSTVR